MHALLLAAAVLAQPLPADGLRGLSHADPAERWYAAQILARSGPKAAPALASLARLLENKEENEYVRGAAARAIGAIGPGAAAAAPLLAEASASSGHLSVRRHATWALGRIGPAARGQLAAIVARTDDADAAVRAHAAVALGRVSRDPRAMVVLRTMAQSSDREAALEAAWALGEIAADAGGAVALLAGLAEHADADVARAAFNALPRAGTEGRLAAERLLASAKPSVRIRAAVALAHAGAPALPALNVALGDPIAEVRRAAARSLGRLGRPVSARQALLGALRDPDPAVRRAAGEALQEKRPETP